MMIKNQMFKTKLGRDINDSSKPVLSNQTTSPKAQVTT